MQIPDALSSLFDDGIIDQVVRPLMSGKEAQVFLVLSQGQIRVAKVYKEAHNRTFKNRAEYTEGRKTRNSRDQRAVEKRSKHGRAQDEAAWKATETDMIHRLYAGGVRVPTPYAFIDGVLVMECVVDPDGNPAPRLGELSFGPAAARAMYDRVIREIVRMLAVGVVHGDLSDFNVLVSGDEPVIIDFPQSVHTANNSNARRLLIRDVDNMHRFLTRHVPNAPRLPYAEEMWELHENNALTADTPLTGRYRPTQRRTSDESLLGLIQDANYDERKRRDALGLRGGPRPAPRDAGGSAPPRPGVQPGQQPRRDQPLHPRGQHSPRGSQQAPHPRGPHDSRGPQQPRGSHSPQPGQHVRGPQQPLHSRGQHDSRGPQQRERPRGQHDSRGPQQPLHPRGQHDSRGPQQRERPQPAQVGRDGQEPSNIGSRAAETSSTHPSDRGAPTPPRRRSRRRR